MNDAYAAPASELTTQPTAAAYVGFWKRVVAALADSVWMMALLLPILYWIYGPEYFRSETPLAGMADFLLSYVVPAVVVVLFWVMKGATPGKMLVGARVVDARTLEPASTGQLIGRYLAYYLSILALMLGFLWVAWDPRKQGFHDKLAGTVVIKSR